MGSIKRRRQAPVAAFLFALAASPAFGDSDLSVSDPFRTQTALDRLAKCVGKAETGFTPEEIKQLNRISSITYGFNPPVTPPPKQKRKIAPAQSNETILHTRNVMMDFDEVSPGGLQTRLKKLTWNNGCDEERVNDFTVSLVSSKRLEIGFHFFREERSCGKFLGIPYTIPRYKADIWGISTVDLNNDLKASVTGTRIVDKKLEGSLFGIPISHPFLLALIGGTTGVLGVEVAKDISDRIADAVADKVTNLLRDTDIGEFQAMAAGLTKIHGYLEVIDGTQFPSTTPKTDLAISGFAGANNNVDFALNQSVPILQDQAERVYRIRRAEIAMWKEGDTPSYRPYTVAKGDNLWSITKSYYPNPKMFILIEKVNSIRDQPLRVGQTIMLPNLMDVCGAASQDQAIVRQGDSISRIRARRNGDLTISRKELKSHNLNLIYPFEEVAAGLPPLP